MRLLFTIMLLAGVVTANLAMAGAPPPPQVTVSDCNTAWSNSSASNTCELWNTWVSDNKCNFSASCPYPISTGTVRRQTSVNDVEKGSVSSLSNCNGHLTVGSC